MDKRILLKLSGEALKNDKDGVADFNYVEEICKKIETIKNKGYEIGIVIGGGNIWRGRQNTYINADISDKIGIISTTLNSMILYSCFDKLNIPSIVLNSFEAKDICNKVNTAKIEESIEKGKIIIYGGGTGHVGCSTDTAASLRAIEMKADKIVKLTNVDGVYDKDPNLFDNAKKYDKISYIDVIEQNLKVMDLSSIEMCKNNNIKIQVMNIKDIDNIEYNPGTIIE